ncbi:energy transducer TonB [Sphingobacterium griseoflavum]|uniref:Biopolymer transporter TonB n=1 Tax=Sphingobacterium griseoflavum TaxID=1474952 RepID=A0ABQ3HUL8_9SPHI|nr:energy transducer TonB [Sphingobacterium griseoflavum]GHE23083.1 biopolymer transporter TonB [Sphingobacterium griseoflavum]
MWNSKLDIYEKEWLDVVFSSRNRSYGAYDLRKHAALATNRALIIVTGAVALLIGTKIAHDQMPKSIHLTTPYEQTPVMLTGDIKLPDPPREEEILIPAEKPVQQIAQDPPNIDLIRAVEPIVTAANAVTEDMVSQDELKDKMTARITLKKVEGGAYLAKGEFGPTKQEGGMTGVASNDIEGGVGGNDIFKAVEVMPEPPGGMKAFVQWVGKNYNYPEAALQQGVKGSIVVSFVVERDGSLTDINVIRDLSFGTGQEAVRVLQKAKKWAPGVQNGRTVRVSYTLPITLSTIQ